MGGVAGQVAGDLVGEAFLGCADDEGGEAAEGGPVAGAALGFAYYKMQWRVSGLVPDLSAWRSQRARPSSNSAS